MILRSHQKREDRLAFTLVELMVSITIIVILATTVLYGMAGVQNTAKAARTKSPDCPHPRVDCGKVGVV